MMLSVDNLSKTFTMHNLGEKVIPGFPKVSFSIGEGKSLALSGPSGTGKSSILKCIYRTYNATSGTIAYRSRSGFVYDLTTASEHDILKLRKSEIGYVTQFLRVLPRVKAVDIVAEPLLRTGITPHDAQRQATELLRKLLIPDDLLNAFPATFSGGEQQRINIARAIISRPRLLLLDEPTASLDRKSIDVVIELLNGLRSRGTTMVMIFHDPKITKALADKIIHTTAKPEENSYVRT